VTFFTTMQRDFCDLLKKKSLPTMSAD